MMQLRICGDTYKNIKLDLRRPHPHAEERVGFAFIRPCGDSAFVVTGYQTVPDNYYMHDETVGARISHKAIIEAMKRADREMEGILYVHSHMGKGFPKFSKTDLKSHPDFLRSFQNANPQGTHGFLLLSGDKLMARVWLPQQSKSVDIFKYTITGLPQIHNWNGRLML